MTPMILTRLHIILSDSIPCCPNGNDLLMKPEGTTSYLKSKLFLVFSFLKIVSQLPNRIFHHSTAYQQILMPQALILYLQ